MPLDPQTRELLDRVDRLGLLEDTDGSVTRARERQVRERLLFGPPQPIAGSHDVVVPGPAGSIRVRIYTPSAPPPFPVVCFLHGGGWALGSLDQSDHDCRAIANAASVLVASVDYRLAPEHRFPAGLEDCFAAVSWIAEHAATLGGDGRPIAVVGQSAGGNLAAALTLLARDRGMPEISRQILIYPVTDSTSETSSYRDFATGYWLTRDSMQWCWSLYVDSPLDAEAPLASPLRAADLTGLPPALVVTAEYDVLRDEAEAYAARLERAGVPVQLTRYGGMVHGFWSCRGVVARAWVATEEVGRDLRRIPIG